VRTGSPASLASQGPREEEDSRVNRVSQGPKEGRDTKELKGFEEEEETLDLWASPVLTGRTVGLGSLEPWVFQGCQAAEESKEALD